MPKATETVLEINLNHLEHNYTYLRSKIKPQTKFLGVVKAFGYGSDAVVIAKKLEELGADYVAVAYVHEGVQLRKAGIKIPILVLHPQTVNFNELLENKLEPSLYSKKILNDFLLFAKKNGFKNYPVHLKFNTGLNRLGFIADDIPFIATLLNENKTLKAIWIFSHLAASEDKNESDFTHDQIEAFKNIVKQIDQQLDNSTLKHLLNTSGIINYSKYQYDMVRSGIGLHGFGNDADFDKELKPIASLKTIISQIHTIKPGKSVGYNRAFKSRGQSKTATLPLGHADGISRHFGNSKTQVLVNNQKAFIIGNICMDMIMIDVTDIECQEGDEVIIFGNNPSANSFASNANTISYELLTGVSQRIKRIFVKD